MGILDYLFGNTYQTPGFNPDVPTSPANVTGGENVGKNTRGGLPNIFMTPNLAEAGLLGTDKTQALALQDALQSQATRAGLLSAGVTFLTQPRNLRAGSALPYLGRAYQQGMASSGDIYGTGLTQLARQQLLAQKSDEDKLYTIDGALVNRKGDVIYQGKEKADEVKLPRELVNLQTKKMLFDQNALPEGETFTAQDEARLKSLESVVKLTSPKGTEPSTMQPPSGFFWKQNPDGTRYINPETGQPVAVPIEGTAEAVKRTEAKEKKEVGEAGKATIAGTVIVDAQRALDTIQNNPNYTTGVYGKALQFAPGTDAYALSQMVNSVKANVGIDKLLDIKASGAGLGQVPQSQLDMLASVLGGLDVGQPADVLQYNLNRVKNIYSDIVKSAGGQIALDKALEESKVTPEAQKVNKSEEVEVDY